MRIFVLSGFKEQVNSGVKCICGNSGTVTYPEFPGSAPKRRSQALKTLSTEMSLMHLGSPKTAHVYPGHGMQGRSRRIASYSVSRGCQARKSDEPHTTTKGMPKAAAA